MKALVTGVTRGIGHAVVTHLAGTGWTVAAVGRNEAALLERHAADGSHLALAAVALLLGRSPSYLRRRWQRYPK